MNQSLFSVTVVGLVTALLALGCAGGESSPAAQPSAAQPNDTVKTVVLKDVHALHGGRKLFLRADGTGICQVIAWNQESGGFHEKRFRLAASAESMSLLLGMLKGDSFFNISIETRAGLPDEARPTIAVTMVSGRTRALSKWASDKNEQFEAIYQALINMAKSAEGAQPEFEGKYDRDWVPEGFSLP